MPALSISDANLHVTTLMNSILNSRAYLDALSTQNTVRQIEDALGGSFAQREYAKSIAGVLSAEKLGMDALGLAHTRDLTALQSMNSLQNAVKEMTSLQGLAASLDKTWKTQSLVDAVGSRSALHEYTKALDIGAQVKKLAGGLDFDYFRSTSLKSLEGSLLSSQAAALGRLPTDLAHAKAQASMEWVDKVSKSMVEDGLYRRFLNTLDIRRAVPSEHWLSAAESVNRRYETLFSSTAAWTGQLEKLTRPTYLNSFLEAIERDISAGAYVVGDSFVDQDSVEDDEAMLQALDAAETPERFAELWARASKWLKWAVMGLIAAVLWPIALNVSSNLITPYVEQVLKQSSALAPREQVKEIKKLSMGELGTALRDCRFVTASTLRLRSTPNSRAKSVDTLQFGQVVTVISTKADWTEVSYEYGDGELVSGWVFTRYLAKFRS
ncbi:SH3 domain-containing protein [Massilia sp. 2TAF26]|uniref:SH3 domain-containing protein n=1 Tax=Massilia sp. 2TAF26 TaxID=3233012 RepID=UPI003F95B5AB